MSGNRFITANGLTLHCTLEGNAAAPPIVFIHALGTSLQIWSGLLPRFTRRFRLVRYDLRGHGLSDAPPGPYSIHDQAQDLAALLAQLSLEAPILVGISVGGLTAMAYALQHPGRVRALVLCDTAPQIGAPEMWNERIQTLRTHGMASLAESILARWFTPEFARQRPADYRGYANMLTRTSLEGYVATCATLRDADLRDQVPGLAANTLVVCGAEDAATPPSQGRALAAALPRARFEVIAGAAHLPCVEQPEVMAGRLEQFFEKNGYG